MTGWLHSKVMQGLLVIGIGCLSFLIVGFLEGDVATVQQLPQLGLERPGDKAAVAHVDADAVPNLEGAMARFSASVRATLPSGEPSAPMSVLPIGDSDPEWDRFERHSASIVMRCLTIPSRLAAKDAYRCRELNPRDCYIPKALREQLQQALLLLEPELKSVFEACQRVYSDDFERARATGKLRDLGLVPQVVVAGERHPAGAGAKLESVSIQAVLDAGADMGVSSGGRVLGVGRKEFPSSRAAMEMERFVGAEVAMGLIAWFQQVGCLEFAEAEQLRALAFR